jgi:beta-glucosidase
MTQATDKIADSCGSQDLASLAFGPPCRGPTSAAALAECLLSLAKDRADALSLTHYGDGGFCGDSHQAVDGQVEALLAQMTLQEKVEQMHGSPGVTIPWPTPDNERLGIPGLHMVDGARGLSAGTGFATAFPVGMARGATWDPTLEAEVGSAIGTEVRARGGTVLLAPVTTVVRHPRWGRSQETYGEDPLHIGSMGVGFVRGVQGHVIASAKHYALNSIEDTRFTVDVSVDERTLREIYLPHFRRVVQEGNVGSIMSAYNLVNGQYCAENNHLLRGILKGDWGFRGFVESDWFAGTVSTVASALNGLDIEMPHPVFYGPALVAAVEAGDVPEAVINEAVRRILRAKLCFRLDTDPPVLNPALVESPEHLALALEVAQKSIVLLKNDGSVLPLDRATISSLAVVGPLADVVNLGDTGSSVVVSSDSVTALEGILSRAGSVAVNHVTDPNSVAGQTALAAADAVVLVVGFTAADEGEGLVAAGDRDTYALWPEQERLIADVAALNDTTIVVLEGGSAIGVESWIDDIEALLMAWYPGLQGGNAIADVLFGDVNPSARLPLVWARTENDLPPFTNNQNEVTYDYYHGYRLLDRDAVDPRFPFGFGLSYTNYEYTNLVVTDQTLGPNDTLRVSFDVTNTGAVAGDEVAQLYVSYEGSGVDRPVRDLKGFARVHLEPAETQTVLLDIPVQELAYYDVDAGDWQVEPITYGVHVGASSRDLTLSSSFKVMKPNIVFVFADDLGYGDLGSYGNLEIDVPHIDSIAEQGARFTQFYTGNSVCSPSRAALLTGRYSIRAGFEGVFWPHSADGLDPSEVTIAEVLKDQGYATALIGKWHLGHLPGYRPIDQGLDLFYGTPYSNDMDAPVFPGEETPVNPCFLFLPDCRPFVPLMEGGVILEMPAIQETLTRRYTQRAIQFMRDAVAEEKPFFLYYASNFPHVPLYASEDFLGASSGGLYGDVVEELDWSVGQLLAELRRLGIDDNTLVVFTSDNGPWLLWETDDVVPQGGLDSGTAGPLRHGKSTTFEGGMRVPMVVRWPGQIPPGQTVDAPAAMEDWMPTLARLAGTTPPTDRIIDGKDIWPLLGGHGERDPNGPFRYLLVRSSNTELGGYIEGKWKLKLKVVGGESVYAIYDHEDLLFDLNADPGEQNDLAPSMPQKVVELKQRMADLANQAGIPFTP